MNAKAVTPKSVSPTCRICGKELTLPESIQKGIGPECEARYSGGVDPEATKAARSVEVVPKGYLPLAQALEIVKEAGIPAGRFWHKACGGNRGFGIPITDDFRAVIFNNKWFVPQAAVNKKNLELVRNLERTVAPKAPKVAKAPAKKTHGKEAPAKKAPANDRPVGKATKVPAKATSKAPAKVVAPSKPASKGKVAPQAAVKSSPSQSGSSKGSKTPAQATKTPPAAKKPTKKAPSTVASPSEKPETVIIGGVPVSKDVRSKIAAGLKKIQAEKAPAED